MKLKSIFSTSSPPQPLIRYATSCHDALNCAGVESMQAKWEEMFVVKEEVKVKKPRKKIVAKKPSIVKDVAKTEKQLTVTKKPANQQPAKKSIKATKKPNLKKS